MRREKDKAAEAVNIEVGKRVRVLRERAEMTQAELGKLLELDRTSVSHVEHGRHSLNLSHLFFLKEYFEVEFDYFLDGLD